MQEELDLEAADGLTVGALHGGREAAAGGAGGAQVRACVMCGQRHVRAQPEHSVCN